MNTPFARLGNTNEEDHSLKRFAFPLIAAIVAILFVVILVYPIMKLSPHDVPVAVLSLDTGAEVAGKSVNAGETLIDQLTGAASDSNSDENSALSTTSSSSTLTSDVLSWTVFDSQEELDEAMDAGEYYLALIIPEDFSERMGAQQGRETLGNTLVENLPQLAEGSQSLATGMRSLSDTLSSSAAALSSGDSTGSAAALSQLSSQMGQLVTGVNQLATGAETLSSGLTQANDTLAALPSTEEKPTVQVVVNQGKNPMVTNSIEPSLVALEAMGVQMEKSYSVELPSEMQRGFSHMPLMIMTYLTSYATGAVIAMKLAPKRTSRRAQVRGLLTQVATSAVAAIFVGFACALVFQTMLGLGIDWVQLALLMALSSFALQMIVVGCLDLFGIGGMIVPLLLMAFCMTSAYLPYEFLPSFWQEGIYPWNPLRHMVDAYKNVIYMGGGFWNASTPYVLVVVAVGLAAMALNLLKKPKELA